MRGRGFRRVIVAVFSSVALFVFALGIYELIKPSPRIETHETLSNGEIRDFSAAAKRWFAINNIVSVDISIDALLRDHNALAAFRDAGFIDSRKAPSFTSRAPSTTCSGGNALNCRTFIVGTRSFRPNVRAAIHARATLEHADATTIYFDYRIAPTAIGRWMMTYKLLSTRAADLTTCPTPWKSGTDFLGNTERFANPQDVSSSDADAWMYVDRRYQFQIGAELDLRYAIEHPPDQACTHANFEDALRESAAGK